MKSCVKNILAGNIEPLSGLSMQLDRGFKILTPAKYLDIIDMKYYPAPFLHLQFLLHYSYWQEGSQYYGHEISPSPVLLTFSFDIREVVQNITVAKR